MGNYTKDESTEYIWEAEGVQQSNDAACSPAQAQIAVELNGNLGCGGLS